MAADKTTIEIPDETGQPATWRKAPRPEGAGSPEETAGHDGDAFPPLPEGGGADDADWDGAADYYHDGRSTGMRTGNIELSQS